MFVICGSNISVKAQFVNGTTGLLHMPTAEMQRDKTFMLGGSFLSKGATPTRWTYDTYNYYINITILPFVEIGYDCTLHKGMENDPAYGAGYWPKETWGKFTNQDRMFSIRLRVLKEGQLYKYMPAIVVGSNDVTSRPDIGSLGLSQSNENGNGFWNRYYIAMTKHFNVKGELGIHAAYVYNRRKDYPLNGPAFGMSWKPWFHENLNLMAEYDSRTVNSGLGYTFWKDHINFVGELNDFKYISVGVVFKVHLK